jgi:SAM-dependent methyltransferase
VSTAPHYWEQRAARYARDGRGLAAVCSFGMPEFHNLSIDVAQRLALRPHLRVAPGSAVLDVGCGVGRWSVPLAQHGARVTGIDLSPTMVAEASRRADAAGVGDRCRFEVGDVTSLRLDERYHLVNCVTVLQHVMDAAQLQESIHALAAHLAPGGRLVALEAAPSRPRSTCDTHVFKARPLHFWQDCFARAGLRMTHVSGVDPAPFRAWLLPHYLRLSAPLRLAALVAATVAALPVDVLLGRRLVSASWHKVMVLEWDAD